jgi:multidrug efflux pump subunit AcrB
MPNPARFSVERPKVVVLFTLLLMIYGVLSYQGLPRQENPALTERFASITTYLPGAEPEKVELLVNEVIEDAIAELDDIEEIFSRSMHGVGWMLVQVKPSAPAAERLQEIRDKVREAAARFPPGASEPDVDIRVFRTNTMLLALVADGISPVALRERARELERELEFISGVRRVDLVGLPKEEIDVSIDLARLAQQGIPLALVIDALAERNVRLPSGELEVGAVRSSIQLSGAFEGVDEVGATLLGSSPEGLPIRLADVAKIERRVADPDMLVRVGSAEGVGIALEMLPNRNAITLGERVRAHLDQLDLPEGMSISIVADEPTYVRERLALLTGSLVFGLGLVVTLCLFGMGWRSGLVVSMTIPLALLVAMGLQGFVNIPLHQISIAALVIAIGIVVDESIVVTDNIQRYIDRGVPAREAAVEGLGEIHLAVLAGAATTVAAFIPLMVMEGDIGDFIRSIPIVVSLMLLGSVLVSHFVTPLLAIGLHQRGGGGPGRVTLWLEPRYRRLAAWIVSHTRAVLLGFVGWLVASVVMAAVVLWPPTFFPDADRHQFLIKLDLPVGAPVEETNALVQRVEALLAEEPEVSHWAAFVGRDAPKFYYNEFDDGRAENRAQIIVNLTDDVPFSETRALATRFGRRIRETVPGTWVRSYPLRQGYGDREDVEIFIMGDDLDVLRVLTARVREVVVGIEGTKEVSDSFGYDPVTLEAVVDDARANLLGVSHREVATTLRTAIDGVTATTFRENDQEIDIRVRLAEGQRRNVADLVSLPLHSPTTGGPVPLSHVASVEAGFTNRAILRYNRKRETVVEAAIADGHALIEVAARVEKAVRGRVNLPPGYSMVFQGQQKEVTESFISLLKAAVVAVFLIYIILVVRFQSLAQPLLILLAVPMSVCGAFWGLALTGTEVSFMGFLGMISLTGIAVNDSIVLVDTVNRLRARGGELADVVAAGATLRLRAVTLTSVTTVGGLLPLSLTGGEFWAPFGFAMIFGLAASTVLTLVVQPAAYLTLDRRLRRGKPVTAGLRDEPAAV